MFRFLIWVFFCTSLLHPSCKDNVIDADKEMKNQDITVDAHIGVENPTNIGRAVWQKPSIVIDKLGDISDKVIADIGAGTGYFSFRLASKAKKVIAIEIEPQLLRYIDSTKVILGKEKQDHIETRLASRDDPKLKETEVDIIVIINTIAYIEHLSDYLRTLKKGLKKGGTLMIIDYKMKRLPINAPPRSERIYLDKLEDLLLEAEYKDIQTDDTSLDYQYIIKASNI